MTDKAIDTNMDMGDMDNGRSGAQDRLHQMQGRASEIGGTVREKATVVQHDVRDRVVGIQGGMRVQVHELKDKAGTKAHDIAGDTPAKLQEQTTKVLERAERTPDVVYLGVVGASMATSALLLLKNRRGMSLFVGLWPVTILNLAMLLKTRHPSQEIAGSSPPAATSQGTASTSGRSRSGTSTARQQSSDPSPIGGADGELSAE